MDLEWTGTPSPCHYGVVGCLQDFKDRRAREMISMRLNIAVSYSVLASDREAKNQDGSPSASQEDRTLTQFVVTQAMAHKWPASLDSMGRISKMGEVKERGDRRMVGRVQNALTGAINDGADHIDISLDVVEWIYKILDEWAAPPAWAGWSETLIDYLESVLLDARQEAKEKEKEKAEAEAAANGNGSAQSKVKKPQVPEKTSSS